MSAAAGERYTGSRVRRVEDAPLLAGSATFVDDIELPGMLHAAFLRSPYAHARIGEINASAARALDGVVAVFTGEDLREAVGPFVTTMGRPEVRTCSQRVLPLERSATSGSRSPSSSPARGTSPRTPPSGSRSSGSRCPPSSTPVALEPGAPVLDEELGDNNVGHLGSDRRRRRRLRPRRPRLLEALPPRPVRCGAARDARRCGVIRACKLRADALDLDQFPHLTRTLLRAARYPGEQAADYRPAVGGGFGAKATVFVEDAVIAAVAARRSAGQVDRGPLREPRGEHPREGGRLLRRHRVWRYRRVLAFRGRYVGNGGACSCNPHILVDALNAAVLLPNMYRVRNLAYDVDAPLTNKCQAGAYRAVGWTSGHTARELLIDELARELSIDPLELRLRNALPPEPYTTPFGQEYDGGSYAESLRRAAEIDRVRRLPRGAGAAAGGATVRRRRLQPYVEPTGWATELARASGAGRLLRHGDGDTRAGRLRDCLDGPAGIRAGHRDGAHAGRC